MSLERQRYVAHRRPVTLERHVEALRLNRERAGVVVCFAVHQQDWILDLIGVPERRHLSVEVRHFPERAALALKAERRQRTIVGATLSEAGAKKP